MKTNATSPQKATASKVQPLKRPENKNKLDSREGEEQLTKGDDTTHNKKEQHNEPNRKKR
jgi:hypothetical protein